jgi:hypothetical protein
MSGKSSEHTMRYYEFPDDRSDTVFDETDETFGPIMAAISEGNFADAASLLTELDQQEISPPPGATAQRLA